MRPETLRRKINSAINVKLKTGNGSKFKIILPDMELLWESLKSLDEPDCRTGFETYGYGDSDKIHNQLVYISDRWQCAFRVKWIIDGVKHGYI